MIQRVWEKCVEALNAEQVIIATDDDRIINTRKNEYCSYK